MYKATYVSLKNDFKFAWTFDYVIFCNIRLNNVDFIEIVGSKLISSQQISNRIVDVTLAEILAFFAFEVDEFVLNEKVMLLGR